LGSDSPVNKCQADNQAVPLPQRKWSKKEVRKFSGLHQVLARLVQGCDLTVYEDPAGPLPGAASSAVAIPAMSNPNLTDPTSERPPLPVYLQQVLLGPEASLLREIIDDWLDLPCGASLLQTLAWNNTACSTVVMRHLVGALAVEFDLKTIFTALLALLRMEDRLQQARLRMLIHGEHDDGLLSFIGRDQVNNPKRAYQYFKFVVELLNHCPAAERFLKADRSWAWVVDWLESQLAMGANALWPINSRLSNETATSRVFQRTISAQDTLQQARRFLQVGKDKRGSWLWWVVWMHAWGAHVRQGVQDDAPLLENNNDDDDEFGGNLPD
jgi:hypothetical protein